MNRPAAKTLRRGLPLLISTVLLIVLAAYTPWHQVLRVLSDFDAGTIILLVALSAAYYGIKGMRFWYMMRALRIRQPLRIVMISYLSAQAITLLPAGEIYRSRTLERYTGVPMRHSLPQFAMQGLFEGSAIAAVGLISALVLGRLLIPLLILALLSGLAMVLIRAGYVANLSRWLDRLPFVHLNLTHMLDFSQGHQAMLSRYWLPRLFGLSLLAELVGTAIAYTAVVGLGSHINVFQASFAYLVPVVVSFLSLLPAGLGASEPSAVGVLVLSHVSVAHAVASTLIMRLTIVGLGLVFGGAALLAGRWLPKPAPTAAIKS